MDPNIKKMCLNFTTFSLTEKGKICIMHISIIVQHFIVILELDLALY